MSWPLVKLSDVCTLINGRAYKKNELLESAKYPVLRVGNFFSNRSWYYSDLELPEKNYCGHGDLLYAWSASFGPRIWEGEKVIYHYHIWKIDLVESLVDKKYLYYALEKDVERIKQEQGSGSTMIHVTKTAMENRLIPLPPLPEQKRIAAILDKADAIHRKRQQAIDLTDEFLRSVFLELFGDPVTNPKGWGTPLLGESIEHANNGLSRRRKTHENKGSLVLRLQDIHYDGIRFEKDLNRIDLDDKEKSRYKLDNGDILFIRVNGNPDYVGRSAVFSNHAESIYHNDHIIRLKLKNNYNPFFLSYLFNQEGGRMIISKQVKTSAGQHTINQSGIKALPIILPPIELQNRFEKFLKKNQSIDFDPALSSELFNSLSQQAFAGKL